MQAIKVGDYLAIPCGNSSWGYAPKITHTIICVDRLTKTQAVCSGNVRIRLADMSIIGQGYCDCAVSATPEILEQGRKEVADRERYYAAKKRIELLEHRSVIAIRKLRIEQLEALADAWEKVLAM